MYHIYSQDYLPSTGSVTVLTDVCTTSTNKTIYHLLALLLSLQTYVPHLLRRLFTIYWLRYCPYGRMYHIYSQDHLPSTGSVTVLMDVCTTSTHKTIYHPLALLLSLRTYVPHLLTRLFTIYSLRYCPYGRMYHIYSQDHLPSTGSVTVLTDVCTISTHKTIYHPLAQLLSLRTYVPYLLTRPFTIHSLRYCPYGRMYHIYSQDHLPSTRSVTVLTDVCTISTHKTIYHLLALLLSLQTYVPHLLTRLFTIYWLCDCPIGRMYHIYSQDYLPSTGSVTVLTDVCTTSTHKTIYHLLALLLSLQTYVPHLLTRLFTIYWLCDCPYGRMYHIYSQDYLPSTCCVTVLTDVCTTSTHKTIYHPLAL